MNYDDYTAAAASTAIYPQAGTGTVPALTYVCLGLVGECSEVLEKATTGDMTGLQAELGDVAWYLARLHAEMGIALSHTMLRASGVNGPSAGDVAGLVISVGRCAEMVKKALRDDAGEITDARRTQLLDLLVLVSRAWQGVHLRYQLDIAATLDANAAKLADRAGRGVLAGSGDTR